MRRDVPHQALVKRMPETRMVELSAVDPTPGCAVEMPQQRLQQSTSVHKGAHIPMLALYANLPSCELLKNGRADIIDVLGRAGGRFLGIAAFKGANHGQVFMADRSQAPVEPF